MVFSFSLVVLSKRVVLLVCSTISPDDLAGISLDCVSGEVASSICSITSLDGLVRVSLD
jgi:hypothetical protein